MKWEKILNIWSIFCWKLKCCSITVVSVRDRVYNDQLTKSKITKLNLATAVILILTNFKLRIISHSKATKILQIRILLKTRMTYLSWIDSTFINTFVCSNTFNYMQSIFIISSSIALKGHFCLLNYRLFKESFQIMFYYTLKRMMLKGWQITWRWDCRIITVWSFTIWAVTVQIKT